MNPEHVTSRLTHGLDFLVRADWTPAQTRVVAKRVDHPSHRIWNGYELTRFDFLEAHRVGDLLKAIDAYYPLEAIIRLLLDNHSAHTSKETMAFLATRPGCFAYVHPPKHGSSLNPIECAFSEMARSFLRHIRVESADELKALEHADLAWIICCLGFP